MSIAQPYSGQLRIPYVRACRIRRGGEILLGMTCNVSVQGVYVTIDPIPELGEQLTVAFALPGVQVPEEIDGMVTWRNTRQQHRVHSFPPGCGLRLLTLTPPQRKSIETLVSEYRPLLPGRRPLA